MINQNILYTELTQLTQMINQNIYKNDKSKIFIKMINQNILYTELTQITILNILLF